MKRSTLGVKRSMVKVISEVRSGGLAEAPVSTALSPVGLLTFYRPILELHCVSENKPLDVCQ